VLVMSLCNIVLYFAQLRGEIFLIAGMHHTFEDHLTTQETSQMKSYDSVLPQSSV
jgi:hypothetical protein